MPHAYRDESVQLYLTVADLARMANLPGKRHEWFMSEAKVIKQDDDLTDPTLNIVRIEFERTVSHKTK